jgi:hypothetical protein
MKVHVATTLLVIAGCGVPSIQISCGTGSLPEVRTRPAVEPAAPKPTPEPAPEAPPAKVATAVVHDVEIPTPPASVSPRPSPFDPPPDAAFPRDPDATAFALHRVDLSPTLTLPKGEPPAGVLVATRTSGTDKGLAFEIDRVPGETLAQTFARVRPWFAGITLPADRRWLFGLVHPVGDDQRLKIEVVEREAIAVHGSDLAWVAVRAGRAGGVEASISASGRARLPAATAPIVGAYYAIAVADRLVWAAHFGGALGSRELQSLGFQSDPTFAAALRDAIAGDPEAVRALAEDRVTDGGTPEAEAAAREAALPPVPVLGADGRTLVTFEPRDGQARTASLVVPVDFRLASRSGFGARWTRGEPPAYLDVGTLGCHPCTDAEIAAQIEDDCREVLQPRPPGGLVERTEIVLDAADEGTRRCGRVRLDAGAGSELRLQCYRQDPGHERAIILSLHTWAADRKAVIDAFETTCATVRAE